jgi:hypothetical protein
MKLKKVTEIEELAFDAVVVLESGNEILIEDDGRGGDFKYCSMTDGVKTHVVEAEFKNEVIASGKSLFDVVIDLIEG